MGAMAGMMGAMAGPEASEQELAGRASELLSAWKEAEPDDQAKVEEELKGVLTETFAVRQRAHEAEIAALEEQVRRLREQLERRKARQAEIVDLRLKQLLREADGLGWGTGPEAVDFTPSGMMPGGMPGRPGFGYERGGGNVLGR